MSINFIVNDPGVGGGAAHPVTPSPDRLAGGVGFQFGRMGPAAPYPAGSADCLAWQAREAALRALNVYESINGPLVGWTGRSSHKLLALRVNAGDDLNAYYDRRSVSFFQFRLSGTGRVVYSGASTDVVAHEVGHAILDALRPDLWGSPMMETAAFHEGFGDCIAIMTALSDRDTRKALLAADSELRNGNFAEATAEELSDAIRHAAGPQHSASEPRRGLNTYRWAIPDQLPLDGPPGVLINEDHCFGQLVSGVYYDLIRKVFWSGSRTEADLWRACQTATALLGGAAMRAPIRPRFLESVGRTMLLVDQDRNRGANIQHIREAHAAHGFDIGAAGMLAPRTSLADRSARRGRRAAGRTVVTPAVQSRLRSVLEVDENTRLVTRSMELGGRAVAEAIAHRRVNLTGLSERLHNVDAIAPQSVFVGEAEGGTAALLGAADAPAIMTQEVRSYVETLVARRAIAFDAPRQRGQRGRRNARGSGFLRADGAHTHVVEQTKAGPTLRRLSFACGCSRQSSP